MSQLLIYQRVRLCANLSWSDLVLAKEDARFAPVVLTLRALRAVGLFACLDRFCQEPPQLVIERENV